MLRSCVRSLYGLSAAVLAAALYSTVFTAPLSAQAPPVRTGTAVLGTDATDMAQGVFMLPNGSMLVTGSLGPGSQPLPRTPGVFQAPGTEFGGAYVAKIAPDGSLEFLSMLSPSGRGEAVAIDSEWNIVVTGLTPDPNFPTTPGGLNVPGQGWRAFVVLLDSEARTLYRSSVIGPVVVAPSDLDRAGASLEIAGPSLRLAVDLDGVTTIAGTAGPDFPTTPGALNRTASGGTDAFVMKLAPGFRQMMYSTLIGGSGLDEAHGLAMTRTGEVYVSGTTASPDFPTTTVLHEAGDLGRTSAFVARLSADGSALDFSTRVSGERGASGRGVAVGPAGDIYLSGSTWSSDFPSTAGRFDTPWYIRRAEGFVMRLTPDGSSIVYSTSLVDPRLAADAGRDEHGSHVPVSIALDPNGVAHIVGVSGAGVNVQANYPAAFEGTVQPNGAVSAALVSLAKPSGAAGFDISINEAGDVATARNTNNGYDVFSVEPTYGKDPFFNYANNPEWEGAPGGMYTDGVVTWSIAARTPPPNTPAGGTATVQDLNGAGSVRFDSVAAAGTTTVTPVDAASLNLALPGGFMISGGSQALEIHTTATVSGITVCLSGGSLTDTELGNATILHGVNGAWQVEPTSTDFNRRTLCATVASLSPFAVGIRLDTAPPVISCAAPAGWSNGPVVVACQAEDAGGLASINDTMFTLNAAVAAGVESASVLTDSRRVCDVAGNCAMAGPISVAIDRRQPVIQLIAPVARRYVIGESAMAAYACTDGGSGIASCTGTVAAGTAIDTATAGAKTFGVTARDAAGNDATASAAYTVGYNVKLLLPQTVVKRNQPAPIAIQLVDAAGANVSAAAVRVTAVSLKQVATGQNMPLGIWITADQSFLFGAGAYGYAVNTKGLAAGVYELQFAAGADPLPHTVQFTVR